MNAESKISSAHLQRSAYLYIRQSSLHQVLENTESTERQYALRRRAVVLGWPEARVVVIDHDQGQSGASAADREGFQRLVADVGLGKAGIVMGLEVSRLARNCADWHRLLEICALTNTLILDEDGVYDPGHYNDRLLLGLKGTMSEAELHILKARLLGGVLNKARRAELKMPLPVGLVYDEDEHVQLDPDQQVQQSLRTFFATFARVGTAWSVMQFFRHQSLKFPRRNPAGSGDIRWEELTLGLALQTLHNPRYAGTFCYGRQRSAKGADGRKRWHVLPREEWRFVKHQAHPGYITWDEFVANEQRLRENRQCHGAGEHQAGPPREGPALLQGLVLCGKCGRTMTVRYHHRGDRLTPDYVCQKECIEAAKRVCQCIAGGSIDDAVGAHLVKAITPLALEAALNVQAEIQTRRTEAARLRRQQVQRAEYEAEQARVRYLRVDPNNRLVADTLETRWNEKLRLLAETREEGERQEQLDSAQLSAEQKDRIRALAAEFPRLWHDPQTPDRDRKRMARLLLEDVTLRREQDCLVQLRFKGGATHELRLPLAKTAAQMRKTSAEVVARMDQLLDEHTETKVAQLLNQEGWRSGEGHAFTARLLRNVQAAYQLKSHCDRLRANGWMTAEELAAALHCSSTTVKYWRSCGHVPAVLTESMPGYLYKTPAESFLAQIRERQRKYSRKAITCSQSLSSAV